MRYSAPLLLELIARFGDGTLVLLSAVGMALSLCALATVGGFVRAVALRRESSGVRPLATDVTLGLVVAFFWAALRSLLSNLLGGPGFYELEPLAVVLVLGVAFARPALRTALRFGRFETILYALALLAGVCVLSLRFWPSLFPASSDPAVLTGILDNLRIAGRITNAVSPLNDRPILYPLGTSLAGIAVANPLLLSTAVIQSWPSLNATLTVFLLFDAILLPRGKRIIPALLVMALWRLLVGCLDLQRGYLNLEGVMKVSQSAFVAFAIIAAWNAGKLLRRGDNRAGAAALAAALLASAIPSFVNPANAYISGALGILALALSWSRAHAPRLLAVGAVALACLAVAVQEPYLLVRGGPQGALCRAFERSFPMCGWTDERFTEFSDLLASFSTQAHRPSWRKVDPINLERPEFLVRLNPHQGPLSPAAFESLVAALVLALIVNGLRKGWALSRSTMLTAAGWIGAYVMLLLLLRGQAFAFWSVLDKHLASMAGNYSVSAYANIWQVMFAATACYVVHCIVQAVSPLRRGDRRLVVALSLTAACFLYGFIANGKTIFKLKKNLPSYSAEDTWDLAYLYTALRRATGETDSFVVLPVPYAPFNEFWAFGDPYHFGLQLYTGRESFYGYLPFWPIGNTPQREFSAMCADFCKALAKAPAEAFFVDFNDQRYCDRPLRELLESSGCFESKLRLVGPEGRNHVTLYQRRRTPT